MSLKQRLPATLRRDERGNVAIIFGLSAVPLLFMLGMSIDFARAYYTRNLLQLSADQAALAASIPSGLTDSQRVQLAMNSFSANTSRSTLTSGVVPCVAIGSATNCTASGGGSSTIAVGAASSAGKVSVAATTNVPTFFLALMNKTSVGVGGQGTVVAGSNAQPIEIGMMIDLTGSMGWTDPATGSPKINSLKTAATSLMNILYPNGQSNANLRVAIAPMADYVNAGSYASSVTGLSSSGGTYANITNLGSTKSGKYTGSYSGIGGGGGGQGFGATGSQTTFTNGYCANPTTTTTTTSVATWSDPTGTYGTKPYINNNNWGGVGGTVAGSFFLSQVSYSYGNQAQTYYYYFGPVAYTDRWGQKYSYVWQLYNNQWYQLGDHGGSLYASDYIPTSSTTTTTSVVAGCESTPTSSGSLISCVTERTGKDAYTDASPAAADYVGAYNQGNVAASNYSSDGKCYVAGRELPAVIPLTNNVSTLTNFINNMSVGGGTPGHLGHAWAWYTVSPNWNGIWPSSSQAAAYGSAKKFVVIMTDGEYNEQYSNTASTTQALNLCTNMKAAGITVYTIGFGFRNGSTPNDGSSDGAALQLLQSCASNNGTFFYPYDGNALKTVFQTVGNSILGTSSPSMLTH